MSEDVCRAVSVKSRGSLLTFARTKALGKCYPDDHTCVCGILLGSGNSVPPV